MRVIAAAVLALVAAGAGAAEAPKKGPVPLKDFARKPEFDWAEISPNGDYLAVAMPIDKQTMLGIIDLKSHKVSGYIRFAENENVDQFYWVGPQRVLATVARSEGPLDQKVPTGELYAINSDGSEQKYLFGYRSGREVGSHLGVAPQYATAVVIDPLPEEPDWALIGVIPWSGPNEDVADISIDRINVHSGERSRVAVLPGYFPFSGATDRAGRLRMAISHGRNNVTHLYAKADTKTGWKEVEIPGKEDEEVFLLERTTADGNSAFVTVSDVKGRECLYEYRIDQATFTERFCAQGQPVGDPLLNFDETKLIGLVHETEKREVQFLDEQSPDVRLLKGLSRSFGGQNLQITSTTLDHKKLVVRVTSDRNPGDFYLVDRETKKADYLLSTASWIDPAIQTPVSPISYKTRDGATIHGYLTAAAGTATRKGPLVLMPHGGPHGLRDDWYWQSWPQALASRGYAVLQVNYRGSGGFGYAHEYAGYHKWGTLMQDDLTDAVHWAIDQGIADPSRICIAGGSYGGYAAVMSPVREPDLYRCAIDMAGPVDLVSQASDSDSSDSRFGRDLLERYLGDDKARREQSPLTYIEKLKVPVLIAHGTYDKRVPFSQAKKLRSALDKLKKPYEWAEYDKEEHGFYVEANYEDFLKKSIDFLDRNIGPNAPAKP